MLMKLKKTSSISYCMNVKKVLLFPNLLFHVAQPAPLSWLQTDNKRTGLKQPDEYLILYMMTVWMLEGAKGTYSVSR